MDFPLSLSVYLHFHSATPYVGTNVRTVHMSGLVSSTKNIFAYRYVWYVFPTYRRASTRL